MKEQKIIYICIDGVCKPINQDTKGMPHYDKWVKEHEPERIKIIEILNRLKRPVNLEALEDNEGE